MPLFRIPLVAVLLLAGGMSVAGAAGPFTRPGQCGTTTIRKITHRLEGMNDSGSAVEYANGLYQVSYDEIPQVRTWHIGDAVGICLVSVPRDCPRGDDRGKVYKVTNRRTRTSWVASDSQHSCGGA